MASVTELGTLIDRDPKVRGGRPKIAGTGLSVSRIAGWYKMGMTPEEIALEYPHLTLAQVHAALAYYYDHQETFDLAIARELRDWDAREAQFNDSPIRKKLRGMGKLN